MSGVALIGCGRVAPCHADAFGQLEGVPLLWACDVVESRARELAARYGFHKMCQDYRNVLVDPEVSMVSLALPHHLHGPVALDAVRSGKHVLVEKPFTIQVQEGWGVVQQGRAAGVVVAPIVQHRFDPALRLIRELCQAEALGRLHLARAHLECFRTRDYYADSPWRGRWTTEGGSVLINQAYHVADLLLWLAGPVEQLSADMATLANPDVMETEDVLCATLRFSSGALGSLTVNGASGSMWDSYLELCGSQGAISFDLAYPNRVHRFRLQSRRTQKQYQEQFDELARNSPPPPPALAYYGISHREQARDFVAQTAGQPTRGATAEEALATVDLIQRIYDACKPG
ncbi:MAG: Gfo/Idh/MocA family oxidoreductase [Candidatus Eremiobacterota bacterium]